MISRVIILRHTAVIVPNSLGTTMTGSIGRSLVKWAEWVACCESFHECQVHM